MFVQAIAIARSRGIGVYEYLWELRLARERFGPQAADMQFALDLSFLEKLNNKARGKHR
jgi:hypothetical protein